MNKEKINKLIATNLFNLKEGEDFGEFPEHDWALNDDGEIDTHNWDYGYHAGVECIRCRDRVCVDCEPDWENLKNCVSPVPDYYSNENYFSAIVEKLLLLEFSICINYHEKTGQYEIKLARHSGLFTGIGDSLYQILLEVFCFYLGFYKEGEGQDNG